MTDFEQLEESLAHQLRLTYQTLMEHSLKSVSCHFLNSDAIAVIFEGVVTQPEKLLLDSGYDELAHTIRERLNDIIRPRLTVEVESILQRRIVDSPTDTKLESDRMSLVIILAKQPHETDHARLEQIVGKY